MPDEIHIAAASDERYAMPLAAMLASVAAHLGPGRGATAHVVESRIPPETKRRMERSLHGHRVTIRWISIAHAQLDSLRHTLRSFDSVSIESYYRLLLPELLPRELPKVLYLDCDLIVNRDLGDLWDRDVGDTCLLAVGELAAAARTVSSPAGVRLHRELELPPDLPFFNSGVLLLNLERCRARRVMERAFAYLAAATQHLRWHDQEALNVAVAGDWRELDPRWNVTMHAFREPDDAAARNCLRDPFIVHYNSAVKPWHADFRFGFGELFYAHLDRTAWAGWRPVRGRFGAAARWGRTLVRAARKRLHALDRLHWLVRLRWHRWWVLHRPLRRLDANPIPTGAPAELRVFLVAERLEPEHARTVADLLRNGADRALIATAFEPHADPAASESIHRFATAGRRRTPHEALRQLLHRYGAGHWCLLLDAKSDHAFPLAESPSLAGLCEALERGGIDGLRGPAGELPSTATDHYATDPLTGRVIPVHAEAGRSRIVLLRYRPEMHLSEDLRAVAGARIAESDSLQSAGRAFR